MHPPQVQPSYFVSCLNTCLGSVRTKTLVTRLRVFKEHRAGLNAGRFQNLSCADTSRGHWSGGASRDRTDDPLLAKQVLSQLSYCPMVGLGGLEPPASPLSGVRSNHLSYRPMKGEPQNPRAKLPGPVRRGRKPRSKRLL